MSEDKQECTKIFMPLNNTNASSPGRLPSFKPRDLKLLTLQGGNSQLLNNIVRPRRTVMPNLNAQRMKDKSENEVKPNINIKRNNFRDRKRDDKKGPGRNKGNNIIQSAGIFAEGYGSDIKRKWESKGGSVYDRHSSGDKREPGIDKPKLKLENNFLCNKAEEDEDLKYLLRDDFLDDPSLKSNDADGPVTLPLKKQVNVKIEKDIKNLKTDGTLNNTKDIKTILFGTHILEGLKGNEEKVKIKQEPIDPEDPFSTHVENHVTLPEKPKLIFFEFPDVLPILEYESSDDHSKPSNAKKIAASSQHKEEQDEKKKRTLADVSEGRLGTMQILKSGKIRLMLGNCPMHVELGTDIHFRQDLLTVNLNEYDHTGTLINLGTINNTFVCAPNLQEIIQKTEKSLAG